MNGVPSGSLGAALVKAVSVIPEHLIPGRRFSISIEKGYAVITMSPEVVDLDRPSIPESTI